MGLMTIFKSLFNNRSEEEEKLLDKLIQWANNNNLPQLKIEKHHSIKGGYHEGIPRNKNKLFNLHTLNLPNCNLDELPKEIGKLKNLKKLWLDENNLTKLPNEICNLNLLEELYIPNNNIEILPENIGKLNNLVEINFKNNNIKSLPISMILIKNLTKINFRSQLHGKKISTPDIISLILSGVFDDDVEFRKKISMVDEFKWNNLKNQFRNVSAKDIKVFFDREEVSYLKAIENMYGKEIADAQLGSNFFEIGKF